MKLQLAIANNHAFFWRSLLVTAASSITLSACGGGSSSGTGTTIQTSSPPPPPPPSASSQSFRNVAAISGVQHSAGFSANYMEMPRHFAGGVASGDIDNDGDIDLFITRGDTEPNLLFINDGTGVFTDNATSAGVDLPNGGTANYKLSGPTFSDMDGDGDLDLFIGGLNNDPNFIYANNGNGIFTDVTAGSGIDIMTSKNTISAAFGDIDNDGDMDLAMAHWGTPRDNSAPGETETLWRNDSDNTGIRFTPISQSSGIADTLELTLNGVLGIDHDYSFAPHLIDVNADGFADLLHVSDFLGSQVFINNGDGTFDNQTDRTQITDSNGMGTAVGDIDNDGDLDWFVSSVDGNRLYMMENGSLINRSAEAGIQTGSWGWGSCFVDFDLDGHLDIYQTNGWINNNGGNPNAPYTQDRTRVWMSNGDGTFTDKAEQLGIDDAEQGRAVVCADFDNDRDIDVLLLLNNNATAAMLWENNITDKNALRIKVIGASKNSHGVGAIIRATVNNVTQRRDIKIGSNFASHNPSQEVIGFGNAIIVDEIVVTWPDGQEETRTNVATNQDLTFTHPSK